MTGIPVMETSRLILRPLALSDADAVQRCFPKWKIVKFLWPYPTDGALTFLRDSALPAMRNGTAWHWSIRPKSAPGLLVGVISLMDSPDNNRGFWLDPASQGQGLMTEASSAVRITGSGRWGRPCFVSPRRSRTNRRAGFRCEPE